MKKNKPKIFYISDHHFCHELARKRSRSDIFADVATMNEEMIRRHNEKVAEDDIVYIIGDVIVCEQAELAKCLSETVGKLKGHLQLILGNHDYKFCNDSVFLQYFESVRDAMFICDGNRKVQLFHYPILQWYRKGKGAYHVHGHLHNERNCKEFAVLCEEERALSAAVEINGYVPCTLDELIENNERFKKNEQGKVCEYL